LRLRGGRGATYDRRIRGRSLSRAESRESGPAALADWGQVTVPQAPVEGAASGSVRAHPNAVASYENRVVRRVMRYTARSEALSAALFSGSPAPDHFGFGVRGVLRVPPCRGPWWPTGEAEGRGGRRAVEGRRGRHRAVEQGRRSTRRTLLSLPAAAIQRSPGPPRLSTFAPLVAVRPAQTCSHQRDERGRRRRLPLPPPSTLLAVRPTGSRSPPTRSSRRRLSRPPVGVEPVVPGAGETPTPPSNWCARNCWTGLGRISPRRPWRRRPVTIRSTAALCHHRPPNRSATSAPRRPRPAPPPSSAPSAVRAGCFPPAGRVEGGQHGVQPLARPVRRAGAAASGEQGVQPRDYPSASFRPPSLTVRAESPVFSASAPCPASMTPARPSQPAHRRHAYRAGAACPATAADCATSKPDHQRAASRPSGLMRGQVGYQAQTPAASPSIRSTRLAGRVVRARRPGPAARGQAGRILAACGPLAAATPPSARLRATRNSQTRNPAASPRKTALISGAPPPARVSEATSSAAWPTTTPQIPQGPAD